MNPTIYTFGDPLLIVEALNALVAIMGAGWVDDSSSFGLGGNLLAAALIGLLGVSIAAISTQQIRIDALFISLLIFAVVFAVDTDVNVEDWYTGESYVVGDVPIGVAFVASAASTASVRLTETIGTAMGSVDVERSASTLDERGFLNPLKILLALRSMTLQQLNEEGHKTWMDFYRYCIGRTEQTSPGKWNTYEFLNTADPIAYIASGDAGSPPVDDWTTMWYDTDTPEGRAESCHYVADQFRWQLVTMTLGEFGGQPISGRLEKSFMRKMGTKTYGDSYDVGDMHGAVQSLFGGSEFGIWYMSRLLMANAHNAGEAWKLAEYGDNKAIYVATLTEAFETKAFVAATEGSVFLQYMEPLMTFMQFLFFIMPPFIAFISIAAPSNAFKVVGYYLLYGVWAYSWLPMAEVINHYMQIGTTNMLLGANLVDVETGYTAIKGFDSLHNILLTQIVIGSNALAAAPVIMAGLLMGTPMAITSIATRLSAGGSVNSDIGAPKLAESSSVFKRESVAEATTGQVVAPGGTPLFASKAQKMAGGNLSMGSVLSSGVSSAQSAATQARASAATTSQQAAQQMRSVLSSSGVEYKQRAEIESAQQSALETGMNDFMSQNEGISMNSGQMKEVMSAAGFRMGLGTGTENANTASFSSDQDAALGHLMDNKESIVASAASKLADRSEIDSKVSQDMRRMSSSINSSLATAETNESYAEEMTATANQASQMGVSHEGALTDIAQQIATKHGDPVSAIMSHATGHGIGNEVAGLAGAKQRESGAVGLGGQTGNDLTGRSVAALSALSEMAMTNPKAAMALQDVLQQEAGWTMPGGTGSRVADAAAQTSDVGSQIADAGAGVSDSVGKAQSSNQSEMGATSSRVGQEAAAINDTATNEQDREALQANWEHQAATMTGQNRAAGQAAMRQAHERMKPGRAEINSGVAAWMQDKLAGTPGYNQQAFDALQSLPSGRGTAAVNEAADLVQGLQSSLIAQGDFDTNPGETFQQFLGAGFTPQAAAAAAFSEAGFSMPSKHDSAALGFIGGAGASAYGTAKDKAAQMKKSGVSPFGKQVAKVMKFGGLPVGAASAMIGYNTQRNSHMEAGQQSDAMLQNQMMNSIREMDGGFGLEQFQEWQQSQPPVESAGDLAGQMSNYYGLGHGGIASDIALQGEMMLGAKDTYGDKAYGEFQSYLQGQPAVQNSQELANHMGMFFEGSAPFSDASSQPASEAPKLKTWNEDVGALRNQIEN